MANIGLVIRPGVKEAAKLGREVVKWAQAQSHKVLLEKESVKVVKGSGPGYLASELADLADPIVTLGGDGTLIGIARYANERTPTMIGVNFGNLGFLTEIAPAELFSVLELVFSGKAQVGTRSMIKVWIERNAEIIFSGQAVNDAVILKDARDKLLDIDLSVNEEEVMRVRADGLIIATPTGSTAYSLAAGGSIAYPTLSTALVTPICPHSLTTRPLILPLDFIISASIPPYEGSVFLSIDGQVSVPLQSGDILKVTEADHQVKFVRSPTKSYFEILRTKLNWGLGNKGGS